jgi:cytochrome bd ubiquinol oxidase subunit II
VILSALCGLGVLAILLATARRRSAPSWALRPLAGGAVIAVIWGWGVAQFPYLLPTSLKVSQSAAPSDTLAAVIVVFIVAGILVLPALALLYWLSQKELLSE